MERHKVKPDFISMATEKYAAPLPVSIRQCLKYYPDATYYVYGCDLQPETVAKLRSISPNVVVKEWELLYLPVNIKYGRRFVRMKTLGFLRDITKSYFTGRFVNKSMESLFAAQKFEVIIQNKLRIIKEHNDEVQKPFIFIDADAFPINPFDELLDDSFDISFTLRDKSHYSYAHNHCALLFAGILWFLGSHKSRKIFIDEWYKEARKTDEMNSEQTSLARWLYKLKPGIYESTDTIHTVNVQGQDIRIKTLDANIYNSTDLEGFNAERDKDSVKVLHFKNSRFETDIFKKLARDLNIET